MTGFYVYFWVPYPKGKTQLLLDLTVRPSVCMLVRLSPGCISCYISIATKTKNSNKHNKINIKDLPHTKRHFFVSYLDNRMESFVCEYDLHLAVFLNSRFIPSEQKNYIVKILCAFFLNLFGLVSNWCVVEQPYQNSETKKFVPSSGNRIYRKAWLV